MDLERLSVNRHARGISQAHPPRSPDPEPDPAVHVTLYLHRVAFTQQLNPGNPDRISHRRGARPLALSLFALTAASITVLPNRGKRTATMSTTSSASSLSASVQSLKSSLQLLDSSISILDQGISDFPRLSTVLSSTRVCSPSPILFSPPSIPPPFLCHPTPALPDPRGAGNQTADSRQHS